MAYSLKAAAKAVLTPVLSSGIQARLVALMARSGIGTDKSLEYGALPMQVHFYSPVPDIPDLKERQVWSRRSAMPGVDFREADQVELMLELGALFGEECDWAPDAEPGSDAFFTENSSFSFGCAAATHCLIRKYRPRRVVEIGSGRSSQVISAALAANQRDGGPTAVHTVVDPYPSPLLEALKGSSLVVMPERAEIVDPAVFEQLESGDVLFIDSGHVVRIGGEVNRLILEVLPRLKSGVVVHLHDIPAPYEYPETYCTNPQFRMFWTESYLLQAFLAFNSAYSVLLGMTFLMTDRSESFKKAFPHYDEQKHKGISSSFWMIRN